MSIYFMYFLLTQHTRCKQEQCTPWCILSVPFHQVCCFRKKLIFTAVYWVADLECTLPQNKKEIVSTFGDSNSLQYAICIFPKFQMHSKVQFTNSFSKKKFLCFEQYVSTIQDCIDHCWLHKLLNSCMTPQRKTCQSTCTSYNVSYHLVCYNELWTY